MSADGHIVDSGSLDGDVRTWCAETGAAIVSVDQIVITILQLFLWNVMIVIV